MNEDVKKLFIEIESELRALKASCDFELQKISIKSIQDKLNKIKLLWTKTK